LHDILYIDAELGKTLQELNALVCRKHNIESSGGGYSGGVANLHYRGAPIADLCLDFTLPGYPDYTLKPVDEIVCLHYRFNFYSVYCLIVNIALNLLSM
jgi:E3 ubiquitin-protein ligase TRIP12